MRRKPTIIALDLPSPEEGPEEEEGKEDATSPGPNTFPPHHAPWASCTTYNFAPWNILLGWHPGWIVTKGREEEVGERWGRREGS